MEAEEGEQASSVVQETVEEKEEQMNEVVKEAVRTNGDAAAVDTKKETNNVADDRSFSVKNLKQPGQWRTHSEIIKIFDVCESFKIEFIAQANKKQKSGVVHFVFPTVKDAQSAYKALESTKLDGIPIEIAVTENFVLPNDFFSIPTDEDLRCRTLYAMNLVTANEEFVKSILGSDAVESVSFLPLDEETQQAQVIMSSAEEAEGARHDANVFDDDDQKSGSEMKLFTPTEYLAFVKEKRAPKPPAAARKEPQAVKQEEPVQLAPEIDEDEVIDAINKHVEDQKLNWAELNEVEELYAICDVVSAKFEGLPDSILKPSMLNTLQRHLSETDSHWLKEHLQVLIQQWKREVASEAPFERETQVVMKAPEYQPVLVTKKKFKEKDTRAARTMMGVGALLQLTRNTLRTENGNVDIDEDDSGNILLNGEALSFDSWAKVTRTNQPEVMSAFGPQDGGQLRTKKQKKQPEFSDYKAFKQYKQEKYEKRMGSMKMKIMKQARDELNALDSVERTAGGSDPAPPAPKVPKELDEGEIDSEEERKEEMNRKRKRSSSSSSSSSSEESDDDSGNARARRAQKRKQKQKKQQANPANNPTLMKMFDFRHQLMQTLPLEQKKLFLEILREKMETRAAPTSDQSHLFRQFSDDCTRLSR